MISTAAGVERELLERRAAGGVTVAHAGDQHVGQGVREEARTEPRPRRSARRSAWPRRGAGRSAQASEQRRRRRRSTCVVNWRSSTDGPADPPGTRRRRGRGDAPRPRLDLDLAGVPVVDRLPDDAVDLEEPRLPHAAERRRVASPRQPISARRHRSGARTVSAARLARVSIESGRARIPAHRRRSAAAGARRGPRSGRPGRR